jgi:predicted RNA-binding protein YlxR (DUF448 family)
MDLFIHSGFVKAHGKTGRSIYLITRDDTAKQKSAKKQTKDAKQSGVKKIKRSAGQLTLRGEIKIETRQDSQIAHGKSATGTRSRM